MLAFLSALSLAQIVHRDSGRRDWIHPFLARPVLARPVLNLAFLAQNPEVHRD
jgi:hypothetical protein